ncbi:hypothetical protein Droror1_Dr00011077 [Drosera rotundifolia]
MITRSKLVEQLFRDYQIRSQQRKCPILSFFSPKAFLSTCDMATSRSFSLDVLKGCTLDGKNYSLWCHRVQLVLETEELKEHILTKMDAPREGAIKNQQRAYEKWIKDDKKALSLHIGLACRRFPCRVRHYSIGL